MRPFFYVTVMRMRSAVWLVLCVVASNAWADRVIGVTDGDTIKVLHGREQLKVRLGNIDAPEKRQPFGAQSKQSLAALCFGRNAELKIQNTDRYGRLVALVSCDGVDVNRAQVERGMAWVYPQYNKDRMLPFIEAQARAARRGLWREGDAMPPWQFRRQRVRGQF